MSNQDGFSTPYNYEQKPEDTSNAFKVPYGTSPRTGRTQPQIANPNIITPAQEHQARVEALIPFTEPQFQSKRESEQKKINEMYKSPTMEGPPMPPPPAGQGFSPTDIPVVGRLVEKGLSKAAEAYPESSFANWWGGGNQLKTYEDYLAYQDAFRARQEQEDPHGYGYTRVTGGIAATPVLPNLKVGQVAETIGSKLLSPVAQETPYIVQKGLEIAGRPIPGAIEAGTWNAADVAAASAPNSSLSDYGTNALTGFKEGAKSAYEFGLPLTAGTSLTKFGFDTAQPFWDPEGYAAKVIAERNANASSREKAKGLTPEKGLGLSEEEKSVLPVDIAGAKSLAEEMGSVQAAKDEFGDLNKALTGRFKERSLNVSNDIASASGRPKNNAGQYMTDHDMRVIADNEARAVNKPAYDAAYKSPDAQNIWNEDIKALVNTESGKRALSKAIEAHKAALVRERKPYVNPFKVDGNGDIDLSRAPIKETMPDGTVVEGNLGGPNLEFWDRFKRYMNDEVENLKKNNRTNEANDLNKVLYGDKNAQTPAGGLVPFGSNGPPEGFAFVPFLKERVPEYETALTGARKYIKEDNAFDGGSSFFDDANVRRKTKDATIADGKLFEFRQMTDGEKQNFRQGLLSRITANPEDAAKVFSTKDEMTLGRYREVLGDKLFNDVDNTLTLHRLASASEVLQGKFPKDPNKMQIATRIGTSIGASLGGVYTLVNFGPQIMQYIAQSPIKSTVAGIVVGGSVFGSAAKNAIHKRTIETKAAAILDMMSKGDPDTFKKIINAGQTDRQINEALKAIEYGAMRVAATQFEESKNERRAMGGRIGRESGGRTNMSAAAKAMRLIDRVDHIRKSHGKETSSLLNLDDNTVAKALDIANQRI
jgi:hypothetical protein